MVELFGKEASGKTTLALHVVKEAQKKGGLYLFMVLAVLFGVYPSSKFYII
jgi:RecA/RadA recombinase